MPKKQPPKPSRIDVRLTPQRYGAFKKLAAKEGVSMAALARQILMKAAAKSKAVLLALVLGTMLAASAMAKEIPAVYPFEVRGSKYLATEVLHVKREKISKWNILRAKRGDKYWVYDTLDGPVRLNKKEHQACKASLKGVPDNRTQEQKHPNIMLAWRGGVLGFNIWSCCR